MHRHAPRAKSIGNSRSSLLNEWPPKAEGLVFDTPCNARIRKTSDSTCSPRRVRMVIALSQMRVSRHLADNCLMAMDHEMASWTLHTSAPAYARVILWCRGLFRRPGSASSGGFSSRDVFRLNPVERILKRHGHARGWCGPAVGLGSDPVPPTWTSDN